MGLNAFDEHHPILRTLRALQPQLHAAGVAHVSVFGSVARGEDTASSDVDLALDLALDLAPGAAPEGFQFILFIERLQQMLALALSRSVDVVILPARRRELREALGRDAIAVF